MANNRMYLVHESGLELKLGSRGAGRYFGAPTPGEFEAFFAECGKKWDDGEASGWDCFELVFEAGKEPGF